MHKRLMATVVAGLVLSAGILGLSACGGSDGNGDNNNEDAYTLIKGEQVTEEVWRNAFSTVFKDDNFSGIGTASCDKITYEQNGDAIHTEETCKFIANFEIDCDRANDKAFSKQAYSMDVIKEPDGDAKSYSYIDEMYCYCELKGEEGGIKNYWDCERDVLKTVDNTEVNTTYDDITVYTELSLDSVLKFSSSYFFGYYIFANLRYNAIYPTKDATESINLTEAYNNFTYKDGLYTSTLFGRGGYEFNISFSIKDGKIMGYKIEMDDTNPYYGNSFVTYKGKGIFNFTYGSTTVTDPEWARKAINERIAYEQSGNG